MPSISVNADRARPVLVRPQGAAWVPSPESGVDRLMLEREGGERARATTIVRFLPGSRFPDHVHHLGEEFLVLEGTFSDEQGHCPTGTYVRNPPGSAHAPYSRKGCTLFVKLRQMAASATRRLVVTPAQRVWSPVSTGVERAMLHADGSERVFLLQARSGCTILPRRCDGGEEILVVRGSVSIDGSLDSPLGAWTWGRNPGSVQPALRAHADTLLWVKSGHLRR